MKFLAVIQVKHLAEQLLCPLCLARLPPKIFFRSTHDEVYKGPATKKDHVQDFKSSRVLGIYKFVKALIHRVLRHLSRYF